jgi:hypothetical protein
LAKSKKAAVPLMSPAAMPTGPGHVVEPMVIIIQVLSNKKQDTRDKQGPNYKNQETNKYIHDLRIWIMDCGIGQIQITRNKGQYNDICTINLVVVWWFSRIMVFVRMEKIFWKGG